MKFETFMEKLQSWAASGGLAEIEAHAEACREWLDDYKALDSRSEIDTRRAARMRRELDACEGAIASYPSHLLNPATRSIDQLGGAGAPGQIRQAIDAFARTGSGGGDGEREVIVNGQSLVADGVLQLPLDTLVRIPCSAAHREALRAHERFPQMGAQSTADAAGGYTVPTFVSGDIVTLMAELQSLLEYVRRETRETGNTVRVPTTDAATVQAQSIAENTESEDATDLVFGHVDLEFDNYATDVLALSRELLEDSEADMDLEVVNVLASWMARGIANALTDSTGGTNLAGFVGHAKVIKALDAAGQAVATLDELRDLKNSVDSRYQRGALFSFSWGTKGVLEKVEVGNRSIIVEDLDNPLRGFIRNGQGDNDVLGRYFINPQLPTIAADAKACYYGDFQQMRLLMRGAGFELLRFTDSPYAKRRQVGFMMQTRVAGKLVTAGNPIKFLQQPS